MKNLGSFIVSFCGVCAAVGGISMILPSGKISKSVKQIISLTVICAFLGLFAVLLNIKISADKSIYDTDFSVNYEETVKTVFESALKSKNIKFREITVYTDKTQDGRIFITKVTVYSAESKAKIVSAIGNGSEYEVEVINED